APGSGREPGSAGPPRPEPLPKGCNWQAQPRRLRRSAREWRRPRGSFAFVQALRGDLGAGIGLLPVDAPVAQLLQRDRLARYGAEHVLARAHHAKAVGAVSELRLAIAAGIHQHAIALASHSRSNKSSC